MTAQITAFALVATLVAGAQEERKPYSMPRKILDAVQKNHGILDALAPFKGNKGSRIDNLVTVDDWLVERYKLRRRKHEAKPLGSFAREISVTLREDEELRVAYQIEVSISLGDCREAAGDAAAMYLFNVPIRFANASFSGAPIGDWTGSWDGGSDGVCLVFIRNNTFVRVSYAGPYEVSRRDRNDRWIRDATLRQRCEELARNIDDLLVRAPKEEGDE